MRACLGRLVAASGGGVLLGLCALGCHPHYAPLLRATHYGAPAVLQAGQLELGASLGGTLLPPTTGGPQLAYAITDWLAIEAGENLNVIDGKWAMGYLGPRLSYKSHRSEQLHFLADFEAGFGLGVGGANGAGGGSDTCTHCDDVPWHQRLAYGSYQGVGIGGQFHWFSIYARARIEESLAQNIALTLWPSAMLGCEFAATQHAKLGLGGGSLNYWNDRDQQAGWFWQLYAAYRWDVRPPRSSQPPTAAVTAWRD